MARNNWSREELKVAFNLYCRLGFTKVRYTHPQIIELSEIIGRTPSAVALKLVNFASYDPELKKRNVKGMSHGSKADEEIWKEFGADREKFAFESEKLLAQFKREPIEESAQIRTDDLPESGKEREALVRVRVNQNFFRALILSSYKSRCCVTGISIPSLLTASHIVPWSHDKENRMNPSNGLCLNAFHDRAFDKGLITITSDYRIQVSKKIKENKTDTNLSSFLFSFSNKPISLPQKFLPERSFLEYHYENIFCK